MMRCLDAWQGKWRRGEGRGSVLDGLRQTNCGMQAVITLTTYPEVGMGGGGENEGRVGLGAGGGMRYGSWSLQQRLQAKPKSIADFMAQ